MTEDEERDRLQTEVAELTAVTQDKYTTHRLARLIMQSVLLLEKSNRSLAASSEKLSKRNLWLTIAVLFVAVLQLFAVILQLWLATAL